MFDPGRFLNAAEETFPIYHPFLVGRHVCIGQRFALAEMKLMLARLLHAFDMSLDMERGSAAKYADWGEMKTLIFWQKEPLYVKTRRAR